MNDSDYSKLSTAELIERIALHSDGAALNELLSQRKLLSLGRVRYLLPEFLWKLKQEGFRPYIFPRQNENLVDEKLDLVYDRTLQKFSVLKPQTETVSIDGPYCNNQYIHLHNEISTRISQQIQSQIDEEIEVGRLFKNLVTTNIGYSWLEACRITERTFARYPWQVQGIKAIQLKRPSWIKAGEFRKWLEQNIDFNHLEKELIQEQIYKRFGFGKHLDFDEIQEYNTGLAVNPDPAKAEERAYLAKHFYKRIADEKSASIQEQRPAIRKLGSEKVRQLVLRILNDYVEQGYKDINIAKEFNLTKATFSRFAGRDWKKRGKDIPDLWRNIARIMHRDPHFSEAAIRLGIKDRVDMILEESEKV